MTATTPLNLADELGDDDMFRKHDVCFPTEGGVEISAWLFVPEGWTAPLPAITAVEWFRTYLALSRLQHQL
jgi:hypothetical protein